MTELEIEGAKDIIFIFGCHYAFDESKPGHWIIQSPNRSLEVNFLPRTIEDIDTALNMLKDMALRRA